jgi:hypothetical protein
MIAGIAFDFGFGFFIAGMVVLAGFVIAFARKVKPPRNR